LRPNRFINRLSWTVLLSAMITLQAAQAQSRNAPPAKGWLDYGGGPDGSHYSPLNAINKSNVNQLEIAWNYTQGSAGFNPIVAGNTIYVLTQTNALAALYATTGKEIWIHANLAGITARGLDYWESKDHKDRRLIFAINSYLQEIDANTGKSIASFGNNGIVDMRQGLDRDPNSLARVMSNTPGKVFEDMVILGSAPGESFLTPPGDLRAWNVITGKLVWQFHTVPLPGEYGADTIPKDGRKYLGAANTWGELTLDEKRGIVYFPTGSMTYDFYGGDRPGSDLFANCLLALDARTGKRLWHFQTVHHDLWDYDNVSAPELITVRKDGKTIDAVALAGKTGFLYVFDRVTGAPVWPIEERPVPASDVPGEKAWPTQPFPTAPPPFARQKFTVDDISPYLPEEERAAIKDQILSARNEGIFTPPSFRGTISMPGNQGGSNWGTTAADPAKGIVYVLSVDEPAWLKLSKDPPINGGSGPIIGWGRGGRPGSTPPPKSPGQAIYASNCQSCHGEDRSGSGSVPSLVNVAMRLPLANLRTTISDGRGQMPAFPNISDSDFSLLLEYIVNPGGGGRGRGMTGPATPSGPVVASGGAPGMEAAAAAFAKARLGVINYGSMQGPPYPTDVDVPADRYFSGWGVSANAVNGPFSTLTAYDLNKGTIKWRVPAGDDPLLAQQGIKGTGARGLRTGIIPTAGGIVFLAGGDGKLRAYDEDTGKVLFEKSFGGMSRGIPVIYEANGREFFVMAGSPGGGRPFALEPPDASSPAAAPPMPEGPTGYIAFALPKK
jgi:quinoprotein glucose dehydrogenase